MSRDADYFRSTHPNATVEPLFVTHDLEEEDESREETRSLMTQYAAFYADCRQT